MLDWLRYFPLALRDFPAHEKVTPKGPYITKLWKQHWKLGDNTFYFKTPWSNSVYGEGSSARKAKSLSLGNKNVFELDMHSYKPSFMPNDHWLDGYFYCRDWLFVGPWFTGEMSCLTMRVSIIQPSENNTFKNASFFHPRVFETAIADYLNSYYGHHKVGRRARYRGPIDWEKLVFSPSVQAVKCDIHDVQFSIENPSITRLVFVPIASNKILLIHFDFNGAQVHEPYVNSAPMFELTDRIVDSFVLSMGEHTQSEVTKTHKRLTDFSVTEEFGELKWPIKPEDVGKVDLGNLSGVEKNMLE